MKATGWATLILVCSSITLAGCLEKNVDDQTQPPVVNDLPTAAAGTNQTVLPDTLVTLDGSASSDNDGQIVSYAWSQSGGPAVALSTGANGMATFTSPSDAATLTFQLLVTDDDGAVDFDSVVITVSATPPDNQPPTANAGANLTVQQGEMVSLNGSNSSDDDGSITIFAWMQTDGPAVTLANADQATATFTAPNQETTLFFNLSVTDDDGATDTDGVTITVTGLPNTPPTANAGPDQTVTVDTQVTLNGTASTDGDGAIAAYLWTQVNGPAVTLDDNTAAQPSFTAPANQTTVTFQLLVTDNDGATDTDTVSITTTAAPNELPVADAGPDQTVNGGDAVTLNGSASDDPDGGIASYAWVQTAGTAVTLSASNAVQPTFTAPAASTVLAFELTVTDDDGATDSDTVSITVNGSVNAPPVANAGPDQTVNGDDAVTLNGSASNDSDGTIASYAWTQTGGATVTLNANNVAQPTFTAPTDSTVLNFTLTVTDDSGDTDTDTVQITVNGTAPVVGLDARPTNANCVAPALPGTAPDQFEIFNPYPNLNLPTINWWDFPIGLHQLPGDDINQYALMRGGRIYRFVDTASVNSQTLVLDISGRVDATGEGGLLGMAFHPNVASNGAVYLSYTTSGLVSRLSQFTMLANGMIDPASEKILLTLNQPFTNHNGGNVAFGPDGYLYIAFGDGGGSPSDEAQNINNFYGALLRIDVRPGSNQAPYYVVPNDNPFVGVSGAAEEVYAYGFRNPWRWSFDSLNGDLWLADVGQDMFEEINLVNAGDNFGWPEMEGDRCYPPFGSQTCDRTGLKLPLYQHQHSTSINSITGGYVYRGSDLLGMDGKYIYADYVSSQIMVLETSDGVSYSSSNIATADGAIVSMAQNNAGEIYFLTTEGIRQLRAASGSGTSNIPVNLSQTGCFDVADPKLPAVGNIPFHVAAPLWSDGAQKERYMAIPDGTTVNVLSDGDFDFPVGTILSKHFENNGTMIETRLLMHHQTGWVGYSYEWNTAQTDAVLLNDAKDTTVAGLMWHYPSSQECRICHTSQKAFALGPEVAQLNHDYTYPSTGRTANQVFTLESINYFTGAPDPSLDNLTLYDLDDTSATLEQRAKSYLHSNCSSCHIPGGVGVGNMDMRYQTPLSQMNMCNFPVGAPQIIPGDATNSKIIQRMTGAGGVTRMPPLATELVHDEAVTLISDWINSLSTCP